MSSIEISRNCVCFRAISRARPLLFTVITWHAKLQVRIDQMWKLSTRFAREARIVEAREGHHREEEALISLLVTFSKGWGRQPLRGRRPESYMSGPHWIDFLFYRQGSFSLPLSRALSAQKFSLNAPVSASATILWHVWSEITWRQPERKIEIE